MGHQTLVPELYQPGQVVSAPKLIELAKGARDEALKHGIPSDHLTVRCDLDDCLLDTTPRMHKVLIEYLEACRGRDGPQEHERMRARADHLTSTRTLAFDVLSVWNQVADRDEPNRGAEWRRFWYERFFRSQYLALDVPLPGMVSLMREFARLGLRLTILSARSEQSQEACRENMRPQSEASLRRHGFPPATLFLKPHAGTLAARAAAATKGAVTESETAFKRRHFTEYSTNAGGHFPLLYLENEPRSLALYAEVFAEHPFAIPVFVATNCRDRQSVSPRARVLELAKPLA